MIGSKRRAERRCIVQRLGGFGALGGLGLRLLRCCGTWVFFWGFEGIMRVQGLRRLRATVLGMWKPQVLPSLEGEGDQRALGAAKLLSGPYWPITGPRVVEILTLRPIQRRELSHRESTSKMHGYRTEHSPFCHIPHIRLKLLTFWARGVAAEASQHLHSPRHAGGCHRQGGHPRTRCAGPGWTFVFLQLAFSPSKSSN